MTLTQLSERSSSMDMESCVPPGFRFHPTEEELVGYYLKRKINSLKIDLDVIVEVDLYKIEPWDIQDKCKLGYEQQNEWYFFSHKDKKYPTGTRTNRATTAGFWKATGRDKAVTSKNRIIGMRKTLVFYKGRAPNGRKTDWIMHEYRHQTTEHGPPQEEGWVVCRAFRKPSPSHRPGFEPWLSSSSQCQQQYFRDHEQCYANANASRPLSITDILNDSSSNTTTTHHHVLLHSGDQGTSFSEYPFSTDHHHQQQFVSNQSLIMDNKQLIELPQLDSPTASLAINKENEDDGDQRSTIINNNNVGQYLQSVGSGGIDWKSLDNLFSSQFTDTTTSATANYFSSQQNLLPLMIPHSHDHQLQSQNQQPNHILGCFPDS